jgi:hypothetical protein
MTKRIGGQSFSEQLKASAHGSMMDPEALYAQLVELIGTMPDLDAPGEISADTHKWLGRACVLVQASDPLDAISLRSAVDWLTKPIGSEGQAASIRAIIYRAFAIAESRAPASAQGAFIFAGDVYDAMVRIGKVFETARQRVLIVDPYQNQTILSDFAPYAHERVAIQLLGDKRFDKQAPLLRPAMKRWTAQYGADRPLTVRLASPRIHDRAIFIDGKEAWSLTQSFNAFAEKAHGMILRVDSELAALKIAAYEELWECANDL